MSEIIIIGTPKTDTDHIIRIFAKMARTSVNAQEALTNLAKAFNEVQIRAETLNAASSLRRFFPVPIVNIKVEREKKEPYYVKFNKNFTNRKKYQKL